MFKKTLILLLVFLHFSVSSQETVCLISWNIRDFGKTKSSEELEDIAEITRHADILAFRGTMSDRLAFIFFRFVCAKS